MTARQWTREALDAAHPLDGWKWKHGHSGWYAEAIADTQQWNAGDVVSARGGQVCRLDANSEYWPAPHDVAMAVILASRGMDSLGAMAAAAGGWAGDADAQAHAADIGNRPRDSARHDGEGAAFERCAAMLRRGTVKP
jgi:hypothetical protein